MIYTLYSKSNLLINSEIDKIKNKNKINDLSISRYNLEEENFSKMIEDATTISMFSDKKLIILESSYFLTGSYKNKELDLDLLSNFLNNKIKDVILIFTVITDKLDERKKIVKKLKEVSTVKNLADQNVDSYIKENLEGYTISENNINLIKERVNDISLIEKELEKLKIYKIKEKEITKEDIMNLTTKTVDLDIYKFIENIIYKNKLEAITTYKELIKLSEEPIGIIVTLSNQIRIMYQSKELSKKGLRENDIATTLDIHPYRVKKALISARNYSSGLLLDLLKKLIKMDLDIKSGNTEKYMSLELFILNM